MTIETDDLLPRSSLDGIFRPAADPRFYRFLRYGHILSSLLRELLEERFLGELTSVPLTRIQFCFLKLIALNTDLQIGEVARCVGVSPPACSKHVDRLEELGLVVRESSKADRRATLLSASDKGLNLVREYEELKATQMAPVIENLGQQRAQDLCELLEEVCLGLLQIESSQPPGPCMRCAGYYHTDCSVAQVEGSCALQMDRDARCAEDQAL